MAFFIKKVWVESMLGWGPASAQAPMTNYACTYTHAVSPDARATDTRL